MHRTIGETLAANTNAFEHTVARQLQCTEFGTATQSFGAAKQLQHLVETERRVDHAGLLLLVGDDTTDEVRVRRVEHSHEVVERLAIQHRDSHE